MKSPGSPVALPLDYASEIAIEMHLMRGECSDMARTLLEQGAVDPEALDECALLDEGLARAHSVLLAAIRQVKSSREKRQRGNE
jgi:hypothetical protein